jgi:hypothetical protein
MELEEETARLRALERLAAEAGREASASRERWFVAVEGNKNDETNEEITGEERIAEESAWELAVWRRASAEARRPALRAEVARARDEFLEGRRERMQVESLVEAAESVKREEGDRREQRRLDDWYQSRPGRKVPAPPTETDSKPVARDRKWTIGPTF